MVLEETCGGRPGHVLEEEEHAVEELHLRIVEEGHMQGQVLEADVDHLVLPLLHVLHPLHLVYVDPQQRLLEGQVGEQLQHLRQHHIPVAEHHLVQFSCTLARRVTVEHLVYPALLLSVLTTHLQLLLCLDRLQLLA